MQPFQVYSRIRPLNQRQIVYGYNKKCVQYVDQHNITVSEGDRNQTIFQLDRVFGQGQGNYDIFNQTVLPLADNFINGINSTIFAYGITGAGKSYTMFGKKNQDSSQPGLIQIALQYICQQLEKGDGPYQLELSYLQIYNEQVFDLFNQKSQNLQILDDPISGVIVYDLKEIPITTAAHALELIEVGNQRRVIAETKANEFSSRSHAIVQLSLQKTVGDIVLTAKFSLVDLAGSQKQNVYSQNKGIRNFQGSNINRSLLTLGNCINILSSKKSGYIPYRDSKLTRLLKDSLGGNTKTAMIACISPSIMTFQQTLNTMKYACRARKIQKIVNQNIREQRSNEQLKKQLMKVKKQMQFYKQMMQNRGSAPKQEIRSLLHQLIKNTQHLTILKIKESNQFSDKVKQLQLIDHQNTISNAIISKFSKQAKLVKDKSSNPLKMLNQNQITAYHQHKIKQQYSQKPNYHLNNQFQVEPSYVKTQTQGKRGAFVCLKLQNIRQKNRQEKRILKDLMLNYYENYEIQDVRQINIQRARQFLSKNTEYINELQMDILNRMIEGTRLEGRDLIELNIQKRKLKPGNEYIDDEVSQAKRQTNNRFLNSLHQIRKMTKKISTKADITNEQFYTKSCYESFQQNYQPQEYFQDI